MQLAELFSVHGKRILITGGGSGLGAHFASVLSRNGAHVAICGRRKEKLLETQKACESFPGPVRTFHVDLKDMEARKSLIDSVNAEIGSLDVLVNNAGVNRRSKNNEYQSHEDFDDVLKVNLSVPFSLSRQCAHHWMEQAKSGSIINIASILGLQVTGGVPAYNSSKAGLVHLTKSLACDFSKHKIRVNAIAPGYFKTEINERMLSNPKILARIEQRIPSGRIGQYQDLDGPLLLLASDASSHMSGATLTVDGGHSCSAMVG